MSDFLPFGRYENRAQRPRGKTKAINGNREGDAYKLFRKQGKYYAKTVLEIEKLKERVAKLKLETELVEEGVAKLKERVAKLKLETERVEERVAKLKERVENWEFKHRGL